MILTVDIGGTKTLLSFWERETLLEKQKYVTREISDFSGFLARSIGTKPVTALCVAAAGPVSSGRVELTNTGQILDVTKLRQSLPQIPRITMLNDLEALGYSLARLKEKQTPTFKKGNASPGTAAVLSLGTGLGVSAVTKEGIVLASEGGHMDFAPADSQQEQIARHLRKIYGHVSYEKVLSGQGLANIHAALSETGAYDRTQEQIADAARDGDPKALESMGAFTRILAAFAGNLALTFRSCAGVYLGGGMTPKLLPLLDRTLFSRVFTEKGRLAPFLKSVPVYSVLDEDAPSLGAAVYAERLAAKSSRP